MLCSVDAFSLVTLVQFIPDESDFHRLDPLLLDVGILLGHEIYDSDRSES
jgi:hypothetical protein